LIQRLITRSRRTLRDQTWRAEVVGQTS
jgi:hypothetical protein